MDVPTLALVLLVLLVIGIIAIYTKYGRHLFDVAVFLTLLLILVGVI